MKDYSPGSHLDRRRRIRGGGRQALPANIQNRLQLDMGVRDRKVFVAGVAPFPRARQKIEIVRPAETGAFRDDRGHDIFQIRRQFQPTLFMCAVGKNRAFVSEGEICQRQVRGIII